LAHWGLLRHGKNKNLSDDLQKKPLEYPNGYVPGNVFSGPGPESDHSSARRTIIRISWSSKSNPLKLLRHEN